MKTNNPVKVIGLYQRVKVCLSDILTRIFDDLAKYKPFECLQIDIRPANSLAEEGLRRGEDFKLLTTITGVLSDPALSRNNCGNARHPFYQIDIFGYNEAVVGEVGSIVSDSIVSYAHKRLLNLRVMDCSFVKFNNQTQVYQFTLVVQVYLKTKNPLPR